MTRIPDPAPRVYVDGTRKGGSPRVYASARERDTAHHQRRREAAFEARRAAGTVTYAEVVAANRRRIKGGRCPISCTCRDCLYPETTYAPRVLRWIGGGL